VKRNRLFALLNLSAELFAFRTDQCLVERKGGAHFIGDVGEITLGLIETFEVH